MYVELDASFRRESARMLASLVRAFGPGNLSLAEDVVQETFAKALTQWSIKGVPQNPSAWLHRVARNLAVDHFRREQIYANEVALESISAPVAVDDLMDDELRMLLLCCHPKITTESQIALTLKAVCGFGVGEIAKALLCAPDAVAQRLVRAKKALLGIEFDLPTGTQAQRRVSTVLRTLYLLFNEGYATHTGPNLTDSELCDEAILITSRLAATDIGNRPDTHALLALMLFHSSRLPARIHPDGSLCLLEEQDRTLWDRDRINLGLRHLDRSATGSEISAFHCEAAIAACHALSPSFEQSNWDEILAHYDDLVRLNTGAIAMLNRTVALSMVKGNQVGLDSLSELECDPKLTDYYLFHATKGRFLEKLGQGELARTNYEMALELATNDAEKQFLRNRIKSAARHYRR